MSKRFIFRWKDSGIEVIPSRRKTSDEVWEWAIKWLRPAGLKNGKQAERLVRREGEVIEESRR